MLHPKNVLNSHFHEEHPNLEEAFKAFPQIQASRSEEKKVIINEEWSNVYTYTYPENVANKITNVKNVDEFWFILKELRDT